MILDSTETTILRAAGIYGWLPADAFKDSGNTAFAGQALKNLSALGLINISRSGVYFHPTPSGYNLLKDNGCLHTLPAKRAYSKSTALLRRLEAGQIALTCLRAGINILCDDMESAKNPPSFLPSFALRRGGNLMNIATCAGFGNFGDICCMFRYIDNDNTGMCLANELGHLHAFAAVFQPSKAHPDAALIFVGKSYGQIYEKCTDKAPPRKYGNPAFTDFRTVYGSLMLPIHLLQCDDTGALQLALMCQPDYRGKLARAAFGSRFCPADDNLPEADGHVEGSPLVIAVDMDVKRIVRVCREAKKLGRKEVMVAALETQTDGLLVDLLSEYEGVTPLIINERVLSTAFGEKIALNRLPRQIPDERMCMFV